MGQRGQTWHCDHPGGTSLLSYFPLATRDEQPGCWWELNVLAVRCARGGKAPARTHQSCQGRVEWVPCCFPCSISLCTQRWANFMARE